MEVWLLLGGGIVSFLGLVLAGLERGSFNQLFRGNCMPKNEAQFCSESCCGI